MGFKPPLVDLYKLCMKLQPFIQHFVPHSSHKLRKKYYGPFPIIGKIGKVAYRFQLPPDAKIHNAFHVSLLKSAYASVDASLDLCASLVYAIPYPQAVLKRRIVKRRNQAATQWLIHWTWSSPADATWEYAKDIQARFLSLVS